jgi:hypothetical protein
VVSNGTACSIRCPRFTVSRSRSCESEMPVRIYSADGKTQRLADSSSAWNHSGEWDRGIPFTSF